MIKVKQRGNFNHLEKFFARMRNRHELNVLNKYGEIGVAALASATPVDTGKTASAWSYEIEQTETRTILRWTNTNTNDGVNIALLLQYGHGLSGGGYIAGIDYIRPAIRPIFENIAKEAWEEVTR